MKTSFATADIKEVKIGSRVVGQGMEDTEHFVEVVTRREGSWRALEPIKFGIGAIFGQFEPILTE